MVKRDLHAHAIGLGTARSRRGEAVPTGLVEREGGVCAKCVRRRRKSEAWRARPGAEGAEATRRTKKLGWRWLHAGPHIIDMLEIGW